MTFSRARQLFLLIAIVGLLVMATGGCSVITKPIGIAYDIVKFPLDVVFD